MRSTIGGAHLEMSVQRKWNPEHWNSIAVRNREVARALNAYPDTFEARVYEVQRQLLANENDQMKQLLHTDLTAGTLERYETILSPSKWV